MKLDVLVAEIGSTTTIVNGFNLNPPTFLGRGTAETTVDSDVRKGLNKAIEDLKHRLCIDALEYDEFFASSSAAGGLRVAVIGLVYEMTVKAAKQAALNAGANLHLVHAGRLEPSHIETLQALNLNMIIIAGGTDYGDKQVAMDNLERVMEATLDIPIIYAGNIENHTAIKTKYANHSKRASLRIVENVYPRVDFLNILPLRKVIYETFEEHIIHAPGMSHIKEMVNAKIMPTPGAVMQATMLLHDAMGPLMTLDVGGATTDVHSIIPPSENFKHYAEGESIEKRTVEGDLGVYINRFEVAKYLDKKTFIQQHNVDLDVALKTLPYIPQNTLDEALFESLTKTCVTKALDRHVGDLLRVYTSQGHKFIPEGRDCTLLETIILTGGSLVYQSQSPEYLHDYFKNRPTKLLPTKTVTIFRDTDYLMAPLGVLSLKYPDISRHLLMSSLSEVSTCTQDSS